MFYVTYKEKFLFGLLDIGHSDIVFSKRRSEKHLFYNSNPMSVTSFMNEPIFWKNITILHSLLPSWFEHHLDGGWRSRRQVIIIFLFLQQNSFLLRWTCYYSTQIDFLFELFFRKKCYNYSKKRFLSWNLKKNLRTKRYFLSRGDDRLIVLGLASSSPNIILLKLRIWRKMLILRLENSLFGEWARKCRHFTW